MMLYSIVLSCAALCAAVYAQTGPILTKHPQETTFNTKSNVDSVSMECKATGDDPITYTWSKDGAVLSHATNNRLIITPGQLTISNPDREVDAGDYVCTATNDVGSVRSLPTPLIFAYVEQFDPSRQLSETLTAGQGGCISCEPPDHYPGIRVIWRHDGRPLSTPLDPRVRAMMDGRLCFHYVELSDAGTYQCEVSSSASTGGGLSSPASPGITVTVNSGSPSSDITIDPENGPKDVTTVSGEDVTFECFFFGPPNPDEYPRISWERVNPPGEIPSNRVFKEQGGEILLITNVQAEDAGGYRCYVGNAFNGAEAVLSVVEPPTWISKPISTMKDINTMVEWIVDATGATEYTWYRNAERLENLPRHQFRNNFQSLTIDDLKTTDTAMYQVFARNAHGIIYSAAQLTVRAFPPVFLTPMITDQPAPLHATVTVVCDVDAAPSPSVTWTRDGLIILHDGRYNLEVDAPNLVIENVQRSDGGTYRCTATNSNGTIFGEGSLDIKEATVIIDPPEATTVELGRSVTLNCRAMHDPYLELDYMWQHNGVQIDMTEIEKYRMSDRDSGNLEILSAQFRDGGEYTCIALTVADSDTSSAMLYIAGPPGPPSGLVAEIDALAANLRWVPGPANNRDITSYYIEGKTNHVDEWVRLREAQNDDGSNSVRLTDLTPYSLYQFRVIAVNTIGAGTPSEPVTANRETDKAAPTKSPTNVGGGGGNEGDLRVTWDQYPRSYWNSDTVSYKVEWQEVGSLESRTFRVEEPEATVFVATSDIKLYTPYEVRVKALNDEGEGSFSDWVVVYSYQEAPGDAPTNVRAERASASTIDVSWDGIDQEGFQGELMGYKLKYWSDASNEANAQIALSVGIGMQNTISGLEANTRYSIIVAAYSGGGDGPDSSVVSDTTYKSEPRMKPTGVRATQSQSGADLTVNWNGITTTSSEEPLIGYKVRFRKEGTFAEDAETILVQGSSTTAIIRELLSDTTYLITVQGYSNGGNGVSSDPPLSVTIANRRTGQSGDGGNGASKTAGVLSFSLFFIATLIHSVCHLL